MGGNLHLYLNFQKLKHVLAQDLNDDDDDWCSIDDDNFYRRLRLITIFYKFLTLLPSGYFHSIKVLKKCHHQKTISPWSNISNSIYTFLPVLLSSFFQSIYVFKKTQKKITPGCRPKTRHHVRLLIVDDNNFFRLPF